MSELFDKVAAFIVKINHPGYRDLIDDGKDEAFDILSLVRAEVEKLEIEYGPHGLRKLFYADVLALLKGG